MCKHIHVLFPPPLQARVKGKVTLRLSASLNKENRKDFA